jgi:tetraacyldisaccharide 4'-kinase
MRAPDFWHADGMLPRLLSPLSALYAWGGAQKLASAAPVRAKMPVVCVGNIVAGGAGKTPVVAALVERLKVRGRHPHILTRGYGGTEAGPRAVDPTRHDATRVGDEALLLSAVAPTWVARWRPDGAAAAADMGADVLVMDDGFQNGTLVKDLSLVVVDGGYGFGNCRVIPAGPCREPIATGLARADAVVMIGDDRTGAAALVGDIPLLRARLVPGPEAALLQGRKLIAFAGIGRPDKFFDTVEECGGRIEAAHSFPDHHPYSRADIEELLAAARAANALPVTTAKDAVRVPEDLRGLLTILTVRLVWYEPGAVDRLLACLLDRHS